MGAELAEGIARRLRFSNDEREAMYLLVAEQSHHWRLQDTGRWPVGRPDARRLALHVGASFGDLMALAHARLDVTSAQGVGVAHTEGREALRALHDHVAALRQRGGLAVRLPKGLGQALIAAGVPQGPELGEQMEWLRQEIIDEHLANSASIDVYVQAVRERRGWSDAS